jgi:hypothetical protein
MMVMSLCAIIWPRAMCRADHTAVDADVALGVPALAPGMLHRLAAPGLREADLIEPRPQGHRASAPEA